MITQPVGCPPVKCLPALMNGCNMSRITTRNATLSLMASHNTQNVPPMDSRGERRRWQLKREGEKWISWILQPCFRVAFQGSKQKKHGVPIWIFSFMMWQEVSVTPAHVTHNEWTKDDRNRMRKKRGMQGLLFLKVCHICCLIRYILVHLWPICIDYQKSAVQHAHTCLETLQLRCLRKGETECVWMVSEDLLISLSSCELGDTIAEILKTTPLSAVTNRFDSCEDSATKGVEMFWMSFFLQSLWGEILRTSGCVATK